MPYEPTIEEQLETAVLAALAPLKAAGVEVQPWPETEKDFDRVMSSARLSVIYHSSDEAPIVDTEIAQQEEPGFLQIMIESKRRTGALGVYDLKRSIKKAVQGLQLDNWTRLKMGKFEPVGREAIGGVWRYNQIIKATAVQQQEIDGEQDDPALGLIPLL